FDQIKSKLISGELDVEYNEFLASREKTDEKKIVQPHRDVVERSEVMNRLDRISSLIKKETKQEE
ncbi:hypothetical protein ACWTQY_26750, partial [Klebsiella pneumoniae]